MKLLDTTVAVDYLRGRHQAHDLLGDLTQRPGDIVASELVRFEIVAGAREPEVGAIERFLAALEWVPVNRRVARVGGELARRYRPSFGGIEDVDYLIAATALILDAELLTTNVKHFPMFAGLEPAY
ncbi:MAG TPA: type II toxin-antitoxin system VapC family toxin [Gaiellaceae bacterium]|nr:type II toxin-antitoxin system VapC family toxin [Gaiellaceae bacterium]